MSKRIILTGSTGFIGGKLLQKLLHLHYEVTELNRTLGDVAVLETWDKLPTADTVIHLAALTFVPDSWKYPNRFIHVNLQGTICALEYCKKHNAKLIFMSSYMYGKPDKLPISEEAKLEAFNPYALSKKMAEEACNFYAEKFDVSCTILRPFNVYGPGQKGDFLIPSILRQIMEGNEIEVKVLEPKRDYIYIEDVLNILVKAIESNEKFSIFNVGTGLSYSVAELIEIIQRILSTNLPVIANGEKRPDEVMDTRADISKAIRLMNWRPEFTLQQGIADMVASMK